MFKHLDGEHPVEGLVCCKIVHIASDDIYVLDALFSCFSINVGFLRLRITDRCHLCLWVVLS